MSQPRLRAMLIVLGCLAGLPGTAQVNIEVLRSPQDSAGWHHQLGLQAGLREGSVERRELGLSARTQQTSGRRRWLSIVDLEAGWQDDDRYSNQGLLHLRVSQQLTGDLAVEGFAQFDHARQRRLLARALAGAGLRWKWVPRLFVGLGVMAETERNDLPPAATHAEHTRHLRGTGYLASHQQIGRGSLAFTAYVQPRIGTLGDRRILAEGTLAAPLSNFVGLKLNLRLRHDSRPVDGIDELDLRFATGLNIDL